MTEAVEKLRAALAEYRERERPRAYPLHKAMKEAKEALPSAFDAENEKKNGPHEQEAYDLYHECEEALKSATTPSTVAARKRSKSESARSDAVEETKCALSQCSFPIRSVCD